MSVIKIKLPPELEDSIDHRGYLGAVMKLGIEREKVGDISVKSRGAQIVIKNEVQNFLIVNLGELTRFSSSEIEVENIENLEKIETQNQIELSQSEVLIEAQKIELTEIVASLRLDNIVATLARTSRNKAVEILEQERVFLNFQNETKSSKQVKVGDIITIRGKGRFEFKEISGNTKKGRFIIKVDKYV